MEIFMRASKNKYRYNYKGILDTSDLWDLSVTSLDTIYKGLKSQLKATQEESLLETKTKEDKVIEDKIEIVKFIFEAKQKQAEARVKARENRAKKQRLLEILANKKDQSLQGKSEEELEKMIEELS